MSWGGSPRGELGGLRRLLPFKRAVPALAPLPGAGRGLGKFVFVAGKAPDGRRGRAGAAVLPFCFREAAGAAGSAQRGGSGARLPGPGRPEEGGEEVGGPAGARGARPPSAGIARLATRAEQARGPGGGADSGAAGAGGGGGGEAAGKEEEAESHSRPASMGRLAPRPLLLALLSLGECARGLAGRGDRGALGVRRGAAAARGLGRRGCRGHSRETRPGDAGGAARRGMTAGPPGANPARQRAGYLSRRRQAEPRPPHVRGEWLVTRCPQPSLPVGRQEPGSP